jgi:hypothetical protein
MSMSKPKYAPTLLVMVDPKGVRSVRGQRRLYDRIRPHLEAIDTTLAARPSRSLARPNRYAPVGSNPELI